MIYRCLVLVVAVALSGCGHDPQGGYQPMNQASGDQQGTPYKQARTQCWQRSMSMNGGNAMDMSRGRVYDQCMNELGWEDPRMRPQSQPSAASSSR